MKKVKKNTGTNLDLNTSKRIEKYDLNKIPSKRKRSCHLKKKFLSVRDILKGDINKRVTENVVFTITWVSKNKKNISVYVFRNKKKCLSNDHASRIVLYKYIFFFRLHYYVLRFFRSEPQHKTLFLYAPVVRVDRFNLYYNNIKRCLSASHLFRPRANLLLRRVSFSRS